MMTMSNQPRRGEPCMNIYWNHKDAWLVIEGCDCHSNRIRVQREGARRTDTSTTASHTFAVPPLNNWSSSDWGDWWSLWACINDSTYRCKRQRMHISSPYTVVYLHIMPSPRRIPNADGTMHPGQRCVSMLTLGRRRAQWQYGAVCNEWPNYPSATLTSLLVLGWLLRCIVFNVFHVVCLLHHIPKATQEITQCGPMSTRSL